MPNKEFWEMLKLTLATIALIGMVGLLGLMLMAGVQALVGR